MSRFLPGTSIELVRDHRPSFRPRLAVFDFDGTLSLVRGGWTEIMVGMMVEGLSDVPRPPDVPDLRQYVTDFVLELNGRPTIFQMQRYAEEIGRGGGRAEPPAAYHQEYLRRIGACVRERTSRIRAGDASPDDLLVPGSRRLLTELASRGIELTLASGTEIEFVRAEAALLEIAHFFDDRIYGPGHPPQAFSKRRVMDELLHRHGARPETLVGFGDGIVETADVHTLGGTAVGVASDERGRSGEPEHWKRTRLIDAGAHVIVPDYRHVDELLKHLDV